MSTVEALFALAYLVMGVLTWRGLTERDAAYANVLVAGLTVALWPLVTLAELVERAVRRF